MVSFLRLLLCIVRKRPEAPRVGLQPIASKRTQSSAEKHFFKVGTSTGAEKRIALLKLKLFPKKMYILKKNEVLKMERFGKITKGS